MKQILSLSLVTLLLCAASPHTASAAFIEIGFSTWVTNPVQTVGDHRFTYTGSSAIPSSARVRLGEPLPGMVWVQLDGGTSPMTNFSLQFQIKHLVSDGHYTSVDLDSITNAPRRSMIVPSQVRVHVLEPVNPTPLATLVRVWGAPSLTFSPGIPEQELWFDMQGTVGPQGLISDAKLELQEVIAPEPGFIWLALPAVAGLVWHRHRQRRRPGVPPARET